MNPKSKLWLCSQWMKPLYTKKVEIQPYFNLDDVCKLALKVEKRKKEKMVFIKPFSKHSSSLRVPSKLLLLLNSRIH